MIKQLSKIDNQLDVIENPAHNINGFQGLYILFCEGD